MLRPRWEGCTFEPDGIEDPCIFTKAKDVFGGTKYFWREKGSSKMMNGVQESLFPYPCSKPCCRA